MKYSILGLLIIIAAPLFSQEIIGTITHWKMDGSCELKDEIMQSPAGGVLVDISSTSDRDNTANAALAFNTTTSYIALGVVEKLKQLSDQSISFWVKPVLSGTNRTGSIFSYGNGIIIQYQEQGASAKLNVIFGGTAYMQVNLQQDNWQQVAITFQKDFSSTKSKAVAYVNGVQVGDVERNKSELNFDNAIALIGPADQNTLTNGFRGSLDDLRIFNRALTSAEVSNLALPVEWLSFNGRLVNKFVELTWRILEENVAYFNLQKSTDGINFKNINKIEAGKNNYLIYDLTGIVSRFAWYRLQAVDNDGKTEFSEIIRVSTGTGGSALEIFPNPGSKYINIAGVRGNGTLFIINTSGMTIKKKLFSAGATVDVSALPKGLYYIMFIDASKQKMVSKFIKK